MGEVPLLKDLYAQYRNKGVVVFGISLDEKLKPLKEMVSAKGITWPQILDTDRTIAKRFNVKGTPTYYLLDREAKIAAKEISMKRLRDAIDDLLKK